MLQKPNLTVLTREHKLSLHQRLVKNETKSLAVQNFLWAFNSEEEPRLEWFNADISDSFDWKEASENVTP